MLEGLLVRLVVSEKHHGLLRYQTCLPQELRDTYMEAYHDKMGHIGVTRCLELLRESTWWPAMRADVRRFIRRCPTCCMTKVTRAAAAGRARSVYTSGQPADSWVFDIVAIKTEKNSSKYTKALVFVDRFSRWVEAIQLERVGVLTALPS